MHFIGTDYATGGQARKTVEPLAMECGVHDLVDEQPHRVPYFEALQCLLDADGLLVTGSNDANYTASKIYPYILARKPLLAVFHERSSVVDVLRQTGAGTSVTFDDNGDVDTTAQRIDREWLRKWPAVEPTTNWRRFEPYRARSMTKRICEVFDLAPVKA